MTGNTSPRRLAAGGLVTAFLIGGCAGPPAAGPDPIGVRPASSPIQFRDVTRELGIEFHAGVTNRTPLSIVELMGGGVGFLDGDGDRWPDIVLAGYSGCAFYRNEAGRRFREATQESGLAALGPGWQGVAVGDYDGDGKPDLLLTGHNRLVLLQGRGEGRFRDVTSRVGLPQEGWFTSAAFADVDGDGRLELFVGRYVEFRPGMPQFLETPRARLTLGPDAYPAQRGILFRLNAGRYEEITRPAGLAGAHGKVLGVAFQDYDGDGDSDLYLANDRVPGDFYRNEGGGRFRNVGVENGTALSAEGNRQAGMGVAWDDRDGDGRPDLVVTTFAGERKGVYHQGPGGLFVDRSVPAGLLQPLLPWVGFGVASRDWDRDGLADLLVANGHVQDQVEREDPSAGYAQPLQLFRQEPGGVHRDLSAAFLPGGHRIVGRGLAVADYDRDGRLDALVGNLAGPPLLLHNESREGTWLSIRLFGKGGNTQGIGARVAVRGARRNWTGEARGEGSYLSASLPDPWFGLGDEPGPVTVEVRWPSGRRSRLPGSSVNRSVALREP